MPARLGGDEFVVLLEGASLNDAVEIAERIREAAYSSDFTPHASEHGVGVSAGIAALEADASAALIMDRADAALYAAKEAGRNRVVVWSPSVVMRDSESVKNMVRMAFTDGGFQLAYQPVISLATGAVAYYESLVRMTGSDGQILGPVQFLPVVDRLGLMPKLTLHVLGLALADLEEVEGCAVSVNLAGSALGSEMLLGEAASIIANAEHARNRILFEIAEADLLSNLPRGRDWMERLGAEGCRFVLDDFGSGVGMFLLLREPHIEQVKLSRTIMRSVVAEKANRDFVRALRELIETQGKVAVASYLETAELVADAKDTGFNFGQGYSILEPQIGLARAIEQAEPCK